MSPDTASLRRLNLIGSGWMVASMAGFAVEDAFIKAASKVLPVSEVLVLFGLGGTIIFALMALGSGQRLTPPEVLSRPMRVRAVFEVCGRLFYTLALALTPLSSATVILQATPLVVVAGAALFLGENVGWRRWAAIFTGLAGVLVILQPGAESFTPLSLLAVAGMLGFAGRDLSSRMAPASLGTAILGFYGFLALIVAGLLFAMWERAPFLWPDLGTFAQIGGAVLAGVAAYSCLMKAMRTGEVAAVTPFRYTRLLFGIGLGVLLFGETVTPPMLMGSALIVASGIFIIARGRRQARPASPR
ncbi:DMT family transporter [Halovulum sp. GXIMD14794]